MQNNVANQANEKLAQLTTGLLEIEPGARPMVRVWVCLAMPRHSNLCPLQGCNLHTNKYCISTAHDPTGPHAHPNTAPVLNSPPIRTPLPASSCPPQGVAPTGHPDPTLPLRDLLLAKPPAPDTHHTATSSPRHNGLGAVRKGQKDRTPAQPKRAAPPTATPSGGGGAGDGWGALSDGGFSDVDLEDSPRHRGRAGASPGPTTLGGEVASELEGVQGGDGGAREERAALQARLAAVEAAAAEALGELEDLQVCTPGCGGCFEGCSPEGVSRGG